MGYVIDVENNYMEYFIARNFHIYIYIYICSYLIYDTCLHYNFEYLLIKFVFYRKKNK